MKNVTRFFRRADVPNQTAKKHTLHYSTKIHDFNSPHTLKNTSAEDTKLDSIMLTLCRVSLRQDSFYCFKSLHEHCLYSNPLSKDVQQIFDRIGITKDGKLTEEQRKIIPSILKRNDKGFTISAPSTEEKKEKEDLDRSDPKIKL